MRVVIAGGGDIGYELARRLAAIRDVVVIAEAPGLGRFEELDVQLVRGNPAHAATLREVGLAEADKFIACAESDELNIVASLAAKRLAGVETFCFVSKEAYYRSFSGGEGGETLLEIDRVIWPQYMLANEISRIVLVPEAIDVEFFAGGRIWLLEFRLQEGSLLVGRPLAELGLPKGLLAVALIRDGDFQIPSGGTAFAVGDKAVFMGRRRAMRRFARRYVRPQRPRVHEVTIVGGGDVGLALAKILEQEETLRVKVIERAAERCDLVASALRSALVLHGDGTDLRLLEAERIYDSDVLVSVTSDDEKNLLCSLLAKQMRIPKIITRVNSPDNIRLFEGVGVDVPLNPRATAINVVLNALQERPVQLLATIERGEAEVLELVVPEGFPPTRLRQMPRLEGAIVGAIVRRRRTLVPHGEDVIEPADRLLVVCTREAKEAVEGYLQDYLEAVRAGR